MANPPALDLRESAVIPERAVGGRAPRHIPALDGLRGLAILLVLLFHVGGAATDQLPWLTDWGWVGVDLFFALSGFLISGILLDSRERPNYFRNFYMRRTLRIFPLYYAVLGLITFAIPLLTHRSIQLGGDWPWIWAYMANLRIAEQGHWLYAPSSLTLDHFWSLAVEEQFYLFWPVVVLLLGQRRLLWACAVAIVTASVFRCYLVEVSPHYGAPYVHTLARLDVLCWGAVAAVAHRQPALLPTWRRASAVVVCVGGALLLLLLALSGFDLKNEWVLRVGLGLTGPVSAGIVFLVTHGAARAMTERRLLRWFGKYSYGLYIFHFLAIRWFERIAGFQPGHGVARQPLQILVFVVVACVVPVVAAVASYQLYEKHFLKLKLRYGQQSPA